MKQPLPEAELAETIVVADARLEPAAELCLDDDGPPWPDDEAAPSLEPEPDDQFVLGDPEGFSESLSTIGAVSAAEIQTITCLDGLAIGDDAEPDPPPFDIPDAEDPCGAIVEPEPPPPLAALTVTHVEAPPAHVHTLDTPAPLLVPPEDLTTSKLDYLAKARKAAQEQSHAPPRETLASRIRRANWGTISITASLAAPLLLAGAWAVRGHGAVTPPILSPAAAEAAAPQPTPDYSSDYQAAVGQIEAGRLSQGVAALRRVATRGSALAQYRLSKLYETGTGVPLNLELARQWAERSAEAGNCRAMHDVGVYFARGEGAPRDEITAFRWFREAAGYGIADSQYNLGVFYQQGRGVRADPREALFWFLVSARNHDLNAVDQAVQLAAQLSPVEVENARARAHAFRAREPAPLANGSGTAAPGLSR